FWNTRIVHALDDENRFLQFFDMIHRSNFFEIFPHLWISFIAVFNPAQIPAICLGMFQKSHQAGHPNDIDGAGDEVIVAGSDGEGHMPSIAASGYHDSVTIQGWLLLYPTEQRF